MKKIAIALILLLIASASADNVSYNGSDAPNYTNNSNSSNGTDIIINQTNNLFPDVDINFSDINMTEAGEKLKNATKTGYEPVDSSLQFLIDASPFILLIIGILVFIFAGFAKLIGILIIIIALIRLLQMMFF
jgi:hypothetical protein